MRRKQWFYRQKTNMPWPYGHRMNNLLKKEERSFFTDSEYKLERPHMQEVAVSIPLWSNEKAEGKDKDTRMVWLGQQFLLKITHDKMITHKQKW